MGTGREKKRREGEGEAEERNAGGDAGCVFTCRSGLCFLTECAKRCVRLRL